jgi:hypothetical protein
LTTSRIAIGALLLAAVGCGNPPAVAPPATPSAQVDIVAEAIEKFRSGDLDGAARQLRQALTTQPNNLTVHYYLGVATSRLDLPDETTREFRWVVAHAPAGSPEAEMARQWLADADARSGSSRRESAAGETTGTSGLRGEVYWTEGAPPVSPARLQLFLKGLPNTPTANLQFVMRTDQSGRFEFKKIPAGTYKLTNKIAGTPAWRLKVQLPPERSVALDLTSANSVRVRDDFPEDT